MRTSSLGAEADLWLRLLKPYARTNGSMVKEARGIGVGLYVSRPLARLMGGDLVCQRVNDRSEFLLTLEPVAVASLAEPESVSVE